MSFSQVFQVNQRNQFCNGVRRAIRAESGLIQSYGELAQAAPTRRLRQTIRGIRRDERAHRRTFRQIRRQFCR